jgi:hypothetical protein
MGNLVETRAGELAEPMQERTRTYPRPSELFAKKSQLPKRAAITAALTRLAAVTKGSVNDGVLKIYADTLEDMPSELLLVVFERAEREKNFLPTPAELREMGGYHQSQLDAVAIDEAWTWVQEYIAKHGPEGRATPAKVQQMCVACAGSGWVTVNSMSQSGSSGKGLTRCSCRTSLEAPAIPERIQYALRQMANTKQAALELIRDAEPKFQMRNREKFGEAFKRAALAPKGQMLLGGEHEEGKPDARRGGGGDVNNRVSVESAT